ncbi:MAG: DHA2 family efflux MFS transporter permease subunit [Eggerthellaceae bacterium]|nr:DHA2 family efflux MFS transporter permease subunit [Eggerthellaceae bacterium]
MGLSRKKLFAITVIMVGTFVTVLNQTLVAPALPSIMEDTHVNAAVAQWLTTGFTLVNAIMIPITAFLQDRFPTKRLFLFSMGVFTVGAVLCGLAANFPMLLAGRLVQAVGAGILMPMSMTVLLVTFPVEKRGVAMGVFGLVIAFGPAIGPTVGGIVVDTADWHLMFLGIAMLTAIVFVLAIFLLEKNATDGKPGDAKFDALSVILSTLGFGGLLYGFSEFGSSGISIASGVAMVVGVVCVIWFFIRQTHLETPMLRVKVLYNRKFLIATIIGMLVQASLLAAPILMPIYIQTLLGESATMSGLVLMPGAIIMGLMNPIAGKLFDKQGPRLLSLLGMGMLFVTTIGFGILGLQSAIWYIVILYMVRMLSMALVNMPITTWGMNALDTSLMNHGTSVNNTLRQVAGSLGTAIVVSVSTSVQTGLTGQMPDAEAAMFGINAAFMVCAAMVLIGFVLTIIFVKGKPGTTDAVGVEAPGGERGASSGAPGAASKANKELLSRIMKTDVYSLAPDDTVQDAMELFITKKISAAPIIDANGEPVGFISDGDILKQLSRQSESYTDPVLLMAFSANDSAAYDEKLAKVMSLPVTAVGVKGTIGVNIHADLEEVCRVLSRSHLKKVPVMEDGRIVGVLNRSDVTQYSMETYLANH